MSLNVSDFDLKVKVTFFENLLMGSMSGCQYFYPMLHLLSFFYQGFSEMTSFLSVYLFHIQICISLIFPLLPPLFSPVFPPPCFPLSPFFPHSLFLSFPPPPSLLSSSLQGRLYYKGWICILIHFFQFFQIRRCQHISVLIKLPHPPETWLCSCISVRGCACVCVLGELPPETKKNKDLQQREKQVAF